LELSSERKAGMRLAASCGMRVITRLMCAVWMVSSACGHEPTMAGEDVKQSVDALDGAPGFTMMPLFTLEHNPNGFVDGSGRPVWLSGMIIDRKAHGWPLINDATLQRIHDNGGNFAHIRLGPFVRWYEGKTFEAYYYNEVEERYDLDRWNEPFWDSVRRVLTKAESLGIYVEVDVADGWTMKYHADIPDHYLSPWQEPNNVNDAKYDCENMMPPASNVHPRWLNKVAEVTAGFPNVIYEIGNETDTCPQMATLEWEHLVTSAIFARRPDATISTNSRNLTLENQSWNRYVNRHQSKNYPEAIERRWNKPAGINEYAQSSPETYSKEVWHGFALGTYLHYWGNDDEIYDQDATLSALHFFQSIVNKTRFLSYTQLPIDKGRLVGEIDGDYVGFLYPDDLRELFITEMRAPQYDVRWYDVMTHELKVAEKRSGGAQPFPRPGPPHSQTWIVHVNAHEEPHAQWLDERFDDLDNGLLHGQHRWARIDDSPTVEGSSAKVVHIPAGSRVIAVDKDVPIQDRGK